MDDRAAAVSGWFRCGVLGLALLAAPAQAQDQPPAGTAAGMPAFDGLNEALAAARARLDELTSAAEIANRANALHEQIQQLEQERAELASELKDARASHRAAERWAQQTEGELAEVRKRASALEDENRTLSELADRATAIAARLRDEIKEAKDEAARALGARDDAERRLVEMQQALDVSRGQTASLQDEIDRVRGELAATSAAFNEEQAAHADARTTVRELEEQVRARESELATSGRQLSRLNAQNAELEREMVALQDAAEQATAFARENLLAMENKIRLLNAALAEVGTGSAGAPVEPAAGPDGTGGPESGDGEVLGGSARGETMPTPRRFDGPIQSALGRPRTSGTRIDGMPLPPATKAAVVRREIGVVPAANAATIEEGLDAIKQPRAAPTDVTMAQFTAALPLERRMQAQGLVADLKAATVDDGLRVMVPGAELFELNSERIEDDAYDTLGKVAELLSIYDDRPVLITGHTDAMGDASYNRRLSERRAALVRDLFVREFDVDARRLEIRGAGEASPIASNATLAGRQANRRVEVTILK